LALIVFRLKAEGKDEVEINKLNKKLQEAVHAQHGFNMTQTVLPGKEGNTNIDCLRFAMGGLRTTEADVLETWDSIEELGKKILVDM
jgi:hypothetical protein